MAYVNKSDIYKLFDESNGVIRLHIADVDMLPTADVEEVVRCKNCELRGTDDCPNSYYLECEGAYVDPMEDDDFCSYGTPKERGDEKDD